MTNEEILEVLTPLKLMVATLEAKLAEQIAAREAERTSIDHEWYVTDFISLDGKPKERWNTVHFLKECKYLRAKPVFCPLYHIDSCAPRNCFVVKLNNVTVTPEWLKEHVVDNDSLYYKIGGHLFYIGACRYVGTR